MKQLLLLIVSIGFLFTANAGVEVTPPSNNSILILYGNILHEKKATIYVFQYNDVDCYWEEIEYIGYTDEYAIVLNPERAYQIWFLDEDGQLKQLYIDPGTSGLWEANMHIDFNKTHQRFAHFYQTCDYDYVTYTTEFVSEGEVRNVPANHCDNCNGIVAAVPRF